MLENYYTNLHIENAFAASLMFVFTYLNMNFIAAFRKRSSGYAMFSFARADSFIGNYSHINGTASARIW